MNTDTHSAASPADPSSPLLTGKSNHRLFYIGISLGLSLAVAGLTFFCLAPPGRVTAVLITYKQSFLETFEFGEDELFIELEYERDGGQNIHKTPVVPVTKLGNGVTWNVSEADIEYNALRRIRVMDEDLISDDIYDSVDVTLGEPLVGSRYAFRVFRSYPHRDIYRPLFYLSGAVFAVVIIFIIRSTAR